MTKEESRLLAEIRDEASPDEAATDET
jgi:hypothetical protein